MLPMLATKGDHLPPGEAWVHEVKWDGVRAIAAVDADGLVLTSRNENPITAAWPDLTIRAGRDLIVDGEIIALNEQGRPDFRTLAERIHVRKAESAARWAQRVPAVYMVFDLLRLDGKDLTGQSWEQRREVLTRLATHGDLGSWQVPTVHDDGAMLFEATRAQGLEGVVSKRRDSTYRPGERSRHWLKFAHRHRGSYVVGGWRPQVGSTHRLAALLVGEVTADGLAYRGRVGSGIGPAAGRLLSELVTPLARPDSPFVDDVPRVDAAGTHWIEPVLVVDVDTHGLGYQRLRQPSFQGVRSDLNVEDLR